ncbi:MAG: class I SAM-dependent methyltransferase [Myxococcota bacterium]
MTAAVPMVDAPDYAQRWNRYWNTINERDAAIVWDVPAEEGVALDWSAWSETLTPGLPLVHLGCGHGRQTAYVAERVPQVIGIDVASAAVERARREYARSNLEFRVADGLRAADMQSLHAELGDCNVYIRAVLHELAPDERGTFIRNALTLTGERGLLHLLELRDGEERLLGPLLRLGVMPALSTVLEAGITPVGVTEEEVMVVLDDRYEVIDRGPALLMRLQPSRMPMKFRVSAWSMSIRVRGAG